MDGLSSDMVNRMFDNSRLILSNRLFFPDHPITPMSSGIENAETFRINRIRHPKCRLTRNLYTVVKEEHRTDFSPDSFYIKFVAKIGNDELGFSTCSVGWIDQVSVEGGEQPFSPWTNQAPLGVGTSARECGLGTVLTELCLIDPQLNYLFHVTLPSKAITILTFYPKQFDDVREYCTALMGMDMMAVPMKGAHAYFNAALNKGYRRMIVLGATEFHYFWVEDVSRRYVSEGQNRGTVALLDECGCVTGQCYMWGKQWFFCKDRSDKETQT